jgi:hypothetical protein
MLHPPPTSSFPSLQSNPARLDTRPSRHLIACSSSSGGGGSGSSSPAAPEEGGGGGELALSREEQQLLRALAGALGVTPEQFVDLACSCPDLLDASPVALRSHVDRAGALLGVSREQLAGLALRAPQAVLQQQPGQLDDQVADISSATGLTYGQVVDMALLLPELLGAPPARLASQLGSVAMVARLPREEARRLVAARPELLLLAGAQQLREALGGGAGGGGDVGGGGGGGAGRVGE